MALVKCPECGKKISDKALVCPKCGFPISETEADNKESNITKVPLTKSIHNAQKIILIAIAVILISFGSFFSWLYGTTTYRIDDSVLSQIGIADASMINNAYGELDRECKLANIFHRPLKEPTSKIDSAFNFLMMWVNDDSPENSEKRDIALNLARPFYYYDRYFFEITNDSDDNLENTNSNNNYELSEKYIKIIEQSLAKVKDECCE